MRLRIALVLGIITALAVGFATIGQAESGFKVTGGGQTDVGTSGAGDTIAFTAQQNTQQGVIGQVQYVDRADGTGKGQTVYHGTVTCLEAVDAGEQGAAFLAGEWRDGGTFEIYVEDNGEPNQGSDIVFLDRNSPPNCDDEEDDDGRTALGRGNVQVHSE